jgi:two-component system, OmpR family, phosphate regulon sensor histidine kinase PhoR
MTLRSPIFRKLLGSAMLLIAATLLGLDFYLTRYTTQREVESTRHRLEISARILAGEIPEVPQANLEKWAKTVGERARARVTFINPSGVVLADSQHDPETMENHAQRPEIRAAVSLGTGSSIRHSATLNRDLCYLAISFPYHSEPGYVLRLAVPLEDVQASVSLVRRRILAASVVAALVALAFAYYFSNSLTRRIAGLRAFAEDLVHGPATGALDTASNDELGVLAQSLNRTSRQLRELVDRLSVESARREAILAGMAEGVLAVNQELRVTFCNTFFLRALGRNAPAAENMPLVELIRDPELRGVLERVLSSGAPLKERIQLASAEGRTFEVQTGPLVAPSYRGAIAILHDITDLERLERVRRDFVANVSHELRTPLTAIRGYAETLLEGALEDPENNRKFLEIIKAHAIRLNNIASDLLALSELESGKAPAEPEAVTVNAAIEAALHTVESEARLRDVRLVWERKDDAEVRGGRTRLEQALINLLDNAIKFNRPGGEVRVATSPAPDGRVRIAVADNGIGIPSEDLSRIFERFYRVDKARSREMGGTGLGLSIVKHVVERMGGSVTAESQLGKGSTFTILLPPRLDRQVSGG